MSNGGTVFAIVEGKTEREFVEGVLKPYLEPKKVYITPIIAHKPGQRGGDIRFDRIKKDIRNFLKQSNDTYVTMLIDFYGIREWPGHDDACKEHTPSAKSAKFLGVTKAILMEQLAGLDVERRFIPYVSMHELEALFFSDPEILAAQLDVPVTVIHSILRKCGEAENINNSKTTAPSKRLQALGKRYGKVSHGLAIAQATGVEKMRDKCPLFNHWLKTLEELPALFPSPL